ncbi:hypothetical protein [Umezawaea sp. Da 62-37]|uniref:hypothetical protein n=1 Tax=Umezawaea sp. Da 62-37 TaxID=3075927 RepID=UPI0028F703E5|nr:hypothetical protein [Umezawaea sp. Da 62-37]WNV89415.1 hypothetical protein RM788_14250 [Umezawaea sp. Da 62-37]
MRHRLGLFALLAGAVLALVGALLPLYRQAYRLAEQLEFEVTAWNVRTITGPQPDSDEFRSSVQYGIPIAVAAGLLVLAALFLRHRRFGAIARFLAAGAPLMLVGVVWTTFQVYLRLAEGNRRVDPITLTSPALGLWILVIACVVALAGGVLVQRVPEQVERAPEPEGPVVYRLPDSEEHEQVS